MTADQKRSHVWAFDKTTVADIDEIMTWFPDAHSIDIWGGPKFRYPFTRKTFRQDCRWREFSSFSLRDPANQLVAFGQIGSRYERAHLARLVAHPELRGRGVGRKLIEMLIQTIDEEKSTPECGLFVYKNNLPALGCYQSLGFEIQVYPDDAPMQDRCFYLTRVVRARNDVTGTKP